MTETTIKVVIAAIAWFGPVLLSGWMARHWLRKDGDKVILVGLFFGLLGAAIAAIALPKLTDEEWEAKGKKVKPEREPGDTSTLVLWSLGGMCLLSIGLILVLLAIP